MADQHPERRAGPRAAGRAGAGAGCRGGCRGRRGADGGDVVGPGATAGAPPRRYPTRTCVACRTPRQKRDLVRVVRAPGGEVAVDPTGRAPGRGAYVCDDPACKQNAVTRGALRRALDVHIPAALFGPPPAPGADLDEMITDHEGGS